jgi:protein translocase SecG subunit
MRTVIVAIQAILAVLLCLCILLQHRSAGISATFGGNGGAYVQRRGAEKLLYQATIVLAIAIAVLTVVSWYV